MGNNDYGCISYMCLKELYRANCVLFHSVAGIFLGEGKREGFLTTILAISENNAAWVIFELSLTLFGHPLSPKNIIFVYMLTLRSWHF